MQAVGNCRRCFIARPPWPKTSNSSGDLDRATISGYLHSDVQPLLAEQEARRGGAPVPAIFPRHVAPAVRAVADGESEIVTMSWVLCCFKTAKRIDQ
jgi:hypothetical protein